MTWCWWCCHEIEGTSLQVPYKYDPMRNKFHTCGQFCSWSCMKTYVIEKYGANRCGVIMANVVVMRKKLYGTIGTIVRAPSRFSLKEFGGPLTIEEFRKGITIDTGAQQAVLTYETQNAETFVRQPTTTAPVAPYSTKMAEISSSLGTNEPLRLKRPKPLKRDENNLEKTLGITRKKN